MYRIRMSSGDEAHFTALEEFCAGVRSGIVAPDALIYHARAEQWIPVNVHPHYKLAFENGRGSNGYRAMQSPTPAAQEPSSTAVGPAVAPIRPVPPSATALPRLNLVSPTTPKLGNGTPIPSRPSIPARLQKEQVPNEVGRLIGILGSEPSLAPAPNRAERQTPVPGIPKPAAVKVLEEGMDLLTSEPMTDQVRTVRSSRPIEVPKPDRSEPGAPRHTPSGVWSSVKIVEPLKPAPGLPLIMPEELEKKAEPVEIESPKPSAPLIETQEFELPKVLPIKLEIAAPEPVKLVMIEPPVETVVAPAAHIAEPDSEDELDIPSHELMAAPTDPEPALEFVGAVSAPAQAIAMISPPRNRRAAFLAASGLAATLALSLTLVGWRPWASKQNSPPTSSPAGSRVTTSAGMLNSTLSNVAAHPGTSPVLHTVGAVEAAPHDSVPAAPVTVPVAPKMDLKGAIGEVKVGADLAQLNSKSSGSAPSISLTALASHYAAAYAAAADDLDQALDGLGLNGLFGKARISTPDALAAGRQALQSAEASLHDYRTRTESIERAYQDTMLSVQRSHKSTPEDLKAWAARASQQDSKETKELTDLLISQADKALALLADEQGKYSMVGDGIKFQDKETSQRYSALRVWLAQQGDAWAQTPEAAIPVSLAPILKAVTKPGPPTEK